MKATREEPLGLSDRDPFHENLARLKSGLLLVLCVLSVIVAGLFFFAGTHLELIARGIFMLLLARVFQSARHH